MAKFDAKQMGIRVVIVVIVLVCGVLVANMVANNYTAPLPDYATQYNDSTLWENTITSTNDTQWGYRRKITVTNPTEMLQSGTYGLIIQYYSPWFGDKKVFKVDYGIVKLVQEFPNADPEGTPLLREKPVIMYGYDENHILVFFNYEVNASATAVFYLYYKQSKDVNVQTYDGVKVGYASLGGFGTNWEAAGWNSNTGFAVGTGTFTKANVSVVKDGDYYYYDHLVVDDLNRWPRYYQYTTGGSGGMRTESAFEAKNKYIRIVGDRYNSLNYNFLGFFNGSLTPGNVQTQKPFIGIQTTPETDDIDNQEYAYAPRGDVNDLFFHYANFTKSAVWKNPYQVPKDTSDIFDWDYKRVDFIYEYFIDGEGNLRFQLSEDGFDHRIITSVDLGKIPWDTVYFQISSPTYAFGVRNAIITDSDVFDSDQSNGVHIEVGYESQLEFMKSMRTENTYTLIIALITLIIVLLHFITSNKSVDQIIRIYLMMMLFVILYLIIKFHPIRYVYGVEDGYIYIGGSESGFELMALAGETSPFLFYFMYFAIPVGILLAFLNLGSKKESASEGKVKVMKIFGIIGLVLVGIMVICFFVPASLMTMSFYIFAIAIFVVMFNSYKDGNEQGRDSSNVDAKTIARIYAKASFVYFVIKILIEAYKGWNVKDPFTGLTEKGFDVTTVLGSMAPLLIGWGIPMNVLEIFALIFSDFVTYIVLGVSFLKQALTSDSNIFGKINSGIWAVYLSIAGDNIHIPFFTLMLSLLTVVGYLIGNRYGAIMDIYSGAMTEAVATQRKKAKPPKSVEVEGEKTKTPPNVKDSKKKGTYEEEIFKLDEQETKPTFGYKIFPGGWLYGDLTNFVKLGECKKFVKIQVLSPNLVKVNDVVYVNVYVLSSPQNKSLVKKEGWLVFDDTTFKRKWKKIQEFYHPPAQDIKPTPSESKPVTLEPTTSVLIAPTPSTPKPSVPSVEPPKDPKFGKMPLNINTIKVGEIFSLEWIIHNADGLPFELRENGITIVKGKWVGDSAYKYVVADKPAGTYKYIMMVSKPGHDWSNEPTVIVEEKSQS